MKNFKVEVSKGLEKYNFIRKSENEAFLKEELHKEWFWILSIQEMDNIEVNGNRFYFEIFQNWVLKTGTIISQDIFKAYLKIKNDLQYNLQYIYQDKETSQEEKEKIIHELQEQYRIYLETNKKQIKKTQEEGIKKIKVITEETVDNFEMKKELDQVYNIIQKVLWKLKNFIDSQEIYLDFEKKEKFKNLYNHLVKLKNSTNIPKLKQVWELALIKVWEIELKILESKKDEESRKLLSETNKLLKEVGSKNSFIPKEQDIWYIVNNFIKSFWEFFKSTKQKKQKFSIDTTSSSYLKTKLLIEKYEKKLKILNQEKIKNILIYIFPSKENIKLKENYYLRNKVLRQNLIILKSRLTGKTYSYSKIVKGYYTFIEKILWFLNFFKNPLLTLIVFYSSIFLILNILHFFKIYSLEINFYGLFYFLFINITFLLLQMVRWVVSLSFNIVILSFLFIFWVINF